MLLNSTGNYLILPLGVWPQIEIRLPGAGGKRVVHDDQLLLRAGLLGRLLVVSRRGRIGGRLAQGLLENLEPETQLDSVPTWICRYQDDHKQ